MQICRLSTQGQLEIVAENEKKLSKQLEVSTSENEELAKELQSREKDIEKLSEDLEVSHKEKKFIQQESEEFKQHAEKKLRAAEDKTEKAGLPVLDHFHTCKYHEVVCPSHGNFGP
ncbi:unnamed protein product [Symbiodinium necroappetens]|uniref:Uncharacterized protein n=1 Tax=Symbiodinium necroappetens TaxID=1628268 RepID=A0A812VK09_9DINO|nr:unnamed protein product [Symbiodinium necroappetens]